MSLGAQSLSTSCVQDLLVILRMEGMLVAALFGVVELWDCLLKSLFFHWVVLRSTTRSLNLSAQFQGWTDGRRESGKAS